MKLRYKLLVICSLLFAVCISAFAQIDREFWLAAPNLIAEHNPNAVKLVLVSYDEDAYVTIEQPAAGRTLLASRQLLRHSVFEFSISGISGYKQSIETHANGEVQQTGIHVVSSANITAYYVTTDPNAEVYTLKGSHGLGTDFVVPTQFTNACGHNTYSSIEVVAVENNTQVTFTTFVPTNENPTPGTFTITLNRGETYAIRSANPNTPAAQHLGGTIVTSTKPIAVNTTDDSAAAGGDLDLIGEQLVPNNLAGNRCIVPANNSAQHEYATFFTVEDSATIHMISYNAATMRLDSTILGTIYPGGHLQQRLNNLQSYVFYSENNMPFVAFHMTANENGNELSGTIMPSLNCSGSQEVNYSPSLSALEAKVTILVHTVDVGSFLVNGSEYELQAEAFNPVPGDSAWSYASCFNLMLGGNESSFRIQNTTGLFHLGILDNGGGACSYGFFSNYGQVSIFAEPERYYYSVGDDVRLLLTGSSVLDNIHWQGPNGSFATNVASPEITNITEADAGRYIVTADNLEGCEVSPDTFFVHVFPKLTDRRKTICMGDSLRLRASGVGPYEWYKNGVALEGINTRSHKFFPEEDAVYTIREKVTGCDMIAWEDHAPVAFSSAAPTQVLYDHQFSHLIPGAEYRWEVFLTAPSNNAIAPKVQLYVDDTPSGIVAVDNGPDTTRAEMRFIGSNRPVRVRLVAISPNADRSMAIADMTLRPTMDREENITVEVSQEFEPHILGRDTICLGDTITLSVDVEGTHYQWSTGDTTATIKAVGPGKYCVYVWRGTCYEMACFVMKLCPPEPTCPDPIFAAEENITVCDTLLPYVWRGNQFSEQGTYYDTLYTTLGNGVSCDSVYYTLNLAVEHCEPEHVCISDQIYQRWNDVLSLKNTNYGGVAYLSCQWFRNGELIPGATHSYVYVPEGLNATDYYHVEFVLEDGTTDYTCPFYPVAMAAAAPLRIVNIRGEVVADAVAPGVYFIIYPDHAEKLLVP